MAYYLVHYAVGAENQYVYPESVAGVVWKSAVYHYADPLMVGETEQTVAADGKDVVALTPAEFKKQVKTLQASFPKLKEPPDPLAPPQV